MGGWHVPGEGWRTSVVLVVLQAGPGKLCQETDSKCFLLLQDIQYIQSLLQLFICVIVTEVATDNTWINGLDCISTTLFTKINGELNLVHRVKFADTYSHSSQKIKWPYSQFTLFSDFLCFIIYICFIYMILNISENMHPQNSRRIVWGLFFFFGDNAFKMELILKISVVYTVQIC